MSSYLAKAKHPKTGKVAVAIFADDFFGRHHYGVIFRKDGKDMTWDEIPGEETDVFDPRSVDIETLE
jgi:hypothetical protein